GIVSDEHKQSLDADSRTGRILAARAQLIAIEVAYLYVAEVAIAILRGTLQCLVGKSADVERYAPASGCGNNRGILQREVLTFVRERLSGPEPEDDLEELVHAAPA